MGPELAVVAPALAIAGTTLGAVATIQQSNAQAAALREQATQEERRAEIEQDWADRRAGEERAAAQRAQSTELRKAKHLQSTLRARAAASGAGVDDGSVLALWGDIEKEGRLNAANIAAAGEQTASGIDYQSGLNSWIADNNARLKRMGASSTLAGGRLSAASSILGGFGRMAARYGGNSSSGSTGYGGYG